MSKNQRKTARCPFCGKFIVMDDATCTMLHDSPICAQFEAKAREFGLKPKHEPWVAVVAPDGSVVTPGKA